MACLKDRMGWHRLGHCVETTWQCSTPFLVQWVGKHPCLRLKGLWLHPGPGANRTQGQAQVPMSHSLSLQGLAVPYLPIPLPFLPRAPRVMLSPVCCVVSHSTGDQEEHGKVRG